MRLPPTLEGRFLARENRFRVRVEVDDRVVPAHLPNSGRLSELLTPGRPCRLVPHPEPRRRTPLDLLLVEHAGVLVSVDARLPGPLFAEAVAEGRLLPFARFARVEREVRCGESRLDFRLDGPGGSLWVETKSVTLVEDGVALFPDAPTLRGQRHLRQLALLAEQGERAAIVFVIQRPDAEAFMPHVWADPAFAAALVEAARVGVEVYAFRCEVRPEEIRIGAAVSVRLPFTSPAPAAGPAC
ncbi:MAG: DNA/RNA nuclease SfsA [Anaerolineae bacterium]|nr:DNA/RNA nuclease SfsA [Anaerolineae bacterium]MDW8068172.1 DNA/RNA nuclease SfsA [Anaerolineae bacterium]